MTGGPRDEAESTPPRRADWGRVADGVFLAGLGVFFLLSTARGLPEGFWVEAVSFWPVLLVSAGIRIIFEKTPLAFGVVLGPLVVLATLFWLAWGDRPELPPPGEWHTLSAERPEGVDRARVYAKLAGVHLDVEARPVAPGLIADGRAASREGQPRVRVTDADGEATLRLRGRRSGFMLIGMRREVWEMGVTDALPLSVDLEGAMVQGDFDLRRTRTTYAEVSGAFNSVTLRLPPPTEQVTIQLEGAFNDVDVLVPEGTPVRYRGNRFPLNLLSLGPATDALAEGQPGYDVFIEGAFTMLDIVEGPPPEGGWPVHPIETPATEPASEAPLAEDPNGAAPPAEAEPRPPAEAPAGAGPESPDRR